ncbi:MAG: response regulator transcription factor [Alphaproteobacteria bacterium]|nr:MAG: response regulator transcription factor [Alphaproteobacteria bacterium]
MRILLIEDDPIVSKSIKATLEAEGMICDTSTLGRDGLEISKIYDYDLILLDLKLPDITGHEVTKKLRDGHKKIPICVISGLTESEEKIKSLGMGADDYITKPFNSSELVARIQAIVRRSQGHASSVINVGKMTINMKEKLVSIEGKAVNLTPKEYSILELLALRKGATLTKEMFLNHLYGGIDEPEVKIIDVFICKLRRKLARLLGDENCISTVWGRGYILKDPDAPDDIIVDKVVGFSPTNTSQTLGR